MLTIPPEIAAAFGTKDPHVLWGRAFDQGFSQLRTLVKRTVERAKIAEYRKPDVRDPGKVHVLRMAVTADDTRNTIALKFALLASPGHLNRAPILLDEARRMSMNLPRGLDGDDLIDAGVYSLVASQVPAGMTFDPDTNEGRSLEPVIMTALIAAVATVLVAIVPLVLPMVVDAAKGAFATVSKAIADATGGKLQLPGADTGPTEAEKAAAIEAEAAAARKKKILLLVGAVVVVGYLYTRKKG
jgi:hypothetical protein